MSTLPITSAAAQPLRPLAGAAHSPTAVEQAEKLRDTFTQFFGETFFGQMIKSMRTTVGEPAYFHGGRAEEIFQGQLDQTLSEEMTRASAERLANPMFERTFPRAAEVLASQEQEAAGPLDELAQLRRR